MARKSRKPTRLKEEAQIVQPSGKIPTALYMRLSKADAATGKDSMVSQEQLLKSHIEKYDDLEIAATFSDDGYTGTNFHRPAYEEMMDGVHNGIYRCIVVKDLSRLGRSYLETSDLLEYELPLFGCRFISVNDNIDTDTSPVDTILVGLKNIMNQKYAEDLSRKIKTVFKARKEQGEYLGGPTPYGYLRDPENRGRLILNEETAPVVQKIFEMKLNRMTDKEIASVMEAEGFLSPSDYRHYMRTGQKPETLSGWSWDMIRRITTNPIYLGHITHDKTTKKQYIGDVRHKTKPSEWTIYENVNPPIVSEEVFYAVKNLRRSLSGKRKQG